MKLIVSLVLILPFVFLGCCPKDGALNRLLYETGQSYDQQKCRENPTAECNTPKSYEQYQNEREELLKKEKQRVE